MIAIYRLTISALCVVIGSFLLVLSWGIGAYAYAYRLVFGRWPDFLASKGGAFENSSADHPSNR